MCVRLARGLVWTMLILKNNIILKIKNIYIVEILMIRESFRVFFFSDSLVLYIVFIVWRTVPYTSTKVDVQDVK